MSVHSRAQTSNSSEAPTSEVNMAVKVVYVLGAVLLSCVLSCHAQIGSCGTSSYVDAGECDTPGSTCYEDPDAKVVGGVEAREHELPYQVAMLFNGNFRCGGMLIDQDHVLTAAHCTIGDSAESFQLVLGEHDRSVPDAQAPNRVTIDCTEIIEHEEYNGFTLQNDIAIMTLAQSVEFDDYKTPVCLSAENAGDNIFGRPCVYSGWGSDGNGGVVDVLKYAQEFVMNYTECQACPDFRPGDILPGMLCSGNCGDNSRDTCQGDSGGPLAVKVDGLIYAAGITSWGYGCADETPGVYTDIAYYESWIRANLP